MIYLSTIYKFYWLLGSVTAYISPRATVMPNSDRSADNFFFLFSWWFTIVRTLRLITFKGGKSFSALTLVSEARQICIKILKKMKTYLGSRHNASRAPIHVGVAAVHCRRCRSGPISITMRCWGWISLNKSILKVHFKLRITWLGLHLSLIASPSRTWTWTWPRIITTRATLPDHGGPETQQLPISHHHHLDASNHHQITSNSSNGLEMLEPLVNFLSSFSSIQLIIAPPLTKSTMYHLLQMHW